MTVQSKASQPEPLEPAFPDVAGEWAMEIYWVRGDEKGKLYAEAFIRQDIAGITMTVRSDGSDSHTIFVKPAFEFSGTPILYYMYEVEPRAISSDATGPYKGAAVLRYYPHGEELSGNYWTSQRTSGRFKLVRVTDAVRSNMKNKIDVLLIAALKQEYDEAKRTFTAASIDEDGVRSWTEIEAAANLPHEVGKYYHEGQLLFSISIARPPRMGGIEMGQFAGRLADRIQPSCLVMCGVCAGNPADLALGDVVVSELAYQYDEGKREAEQFVGDHRQSLVSEGWQRAAESLRTDTLPSYGQPSSRDARLWLLEQLYAGGDPTSHPARPRYFARGKWKAMVNMLQSEGVIELDGSSLKLTSSGVMEVNESKIVDVDPPEKLPFSIKVGPIASGNVVVKDGVTWDSLKFMGVRSVIGLEMEAAAIGRVARALRIPEWIVIKGVMDYADPKKSDRYKPFAARASSEVLRAFLVERFSSGPIGVGSPLPTRFSSSLGETLDSWRPNAIEGPFFEDLRTEIARSAPKFISIFDLAVAEAREAREQASLAAEKSEAVRSAIGDAIAKSYRRKIGEKPLLLRVPGSDGPRSLVAKIWDSHDEYNGEAAGGEPEGLGIMKVYEVSAAFTPSSYARYAGRMEAGKYGPLGVFTFFDQSQFAGRWVSGHPHFGYRCYTGAMNKLDCDFYLGAMSGVANHLQPIWRPHGEGIAVDVGTRRVRCGLFQDGELHRLSYEFDI